MTIFQVHMVPAGVDEQLATVENPQHRHILKNYRRHGLLEVAGRWEEILIPEMTIESPQYRLQDHGQTLVLNGMDDVAKFYGTTAANGDNVFGPIEEHVAVSDHGIFSDGVFAWVVPGTHELLAHDDVDPSKTYQITQNMAMVWPYQGGRLYGEHVYEDLSSRKVEEVPASAITTPAQSREKTAPLIDQTPLEEIIAGLKLFES
ncbi:hypothetical protein [Corynebacterium lubricantis]|uniref:hypothetical protein n=1 Tax=Corynebacterium lubricantis TaxID=541095 RepID=UPI0003A8C37F|nr:hypothetical protein [Corynebacterium lubricantis]